MRADSSEGLAQVNKLEKEIQALEIVQQMRQKTAGGDNAEWYETRK
jgi:hypothetical protein